MKIALTVFVWLIAAALPALAQEQTPSLFFTDGELARIEEAVRALPASKRMHAKHLLHLGSIVYVGPENWVVWLQGDKWTPETDRPNMHIVEVTANEVLLSLVPRRDEPPQTVTLRPHQSYNLLTGEVIEGW